MSSGNEQSASALADEDNKTERKRQREKQRRSDLANAFDELANLISTDTLHFDLDSSQNSKRSRRRRSASQDNVDPSGDASNLTRLDLITRTIETIRGLRRENMELKTRLQSTGDKVSLLPV
jgi:hypothetical protein